MNPNPLKTITPIAPRHNEGKIITVQGGQLLDAMTSGHLLVPAPQRPQNSWNLKQRQDLVDFILGQYGKSRFSVPTIVVLEVTDEDGEVYWLVYDGQHRLSTFASFILDKNITVGNTDAIEDAYPFNLIHAGFALTDNDNGSSNLPKEAFGKTYRELPEDLQNFIFNTRFDVKVYSELDFDRLRADQELFPALQNGKRLTTGQKLHANHSFSDNTLVSALKEHDLFTRLNGTKKFTKVAGDTNYNPLIASLIYTVENFKNRHLPYKVATRKQDLPKATIIDTAFSDIRYQDDIEPWTKRDDGLPAVSRTSADIQRYLDVLEDMLFVLKHEEYPKDPISMKEFIILFAILDREKNRRTGEDFVIFRDIVRDVYHSTDYKDMHQTDAWGKHKQSHRKQDVHCAYLLVWEQVRKLMALRNYREEVA